MGQGQNIGGRLLQHINDATSFRDLTGKLDPFLRESTHIDEWELRIKPCGKEDLNKLEYKIYSEMKSEDNDLLNVRSPPSTSK